MTNLREQAVVNDVPEHLEDVLETPLFDVLVILTQAKKKILVGTLLGTAFGVFLALVIKPTFTANATILPPQAPQSSLSSLMGQLGSLSGLSGGSGGLLKNPADVYVGIIQSRTLTDEVITHFGLQALWKLRYQEDARKRFHSMVQSESTKNGLIQITVKDTDPQRASNVANYLIDALYGMNSRLAVTEAAQRRVFFDHQLDDERTALAEAENELKDTQQKTGLITLNGQAELAVRSVAQTRAEISSKEVALQGLRAYESEQNPDVVQLNDQIRALRTQLITLENNQAQLAPGDTQISANQVPAGGLAYARKLREVRYHETLLDLLSRQYEAARIDEGKSAPLIQIVDRAVAPDRKSGPSRLLLVLGMAMAGCLISCGQILSRYALLRARRTPQMAKKLDMLLSRTS